VPEKVLDRGQIGISMEKLRGHRVPQMIGGDEEPCLAGVGFPALLVRGDGS
jgi:hypothetical protein